MAEWISFFEIAIASHRNAMRAQYKDRPKKSTNGVGMITPLHFEAHFVTVILHNYYKFSEVTEKPHLAGQRHHCFLQLSRQTRHIRAKMRNKKLIIQSKCRLNMLQYK